MGVQNDMKSPVSPQEWYEAGVLFRREERFGEAINAFARAAELASEEMAGIKSALSDGAEQCERPTSTDEGVDKDRLSELEKIRAAALTSIDLIREITSFANTDLMNP